jgi:hypothetical protein
MHHASTGAHNSATCNYVHGGASQGINLFIQDLTELKDTHRHHRRQHTAVSALARTALIYGSNAEQPRLFQHRSFVRLVTLAIYRHTQLRQTE